MNERGCGVLVKYDLRVMNTKRIRGAVLCETDRGLKVLKEYGGTAGRAEWEDRILAGLELPGNLYVDQYVRTVDNELLAVDEDGPAYILKDWFDGRECDVRDQAEIVRCVRELAVLHRALRQTDIKDRQEAHESSPWWTDYERHNREFKRTKAFIRNVRSKTEFEFLITESYQEFFDEALTALELMKDIQEAGGELLHGDFNHHHILVGKRYVAVTDFSRMKYGNQMWDLYHFMRKIMEKHDWDLRLGMMMFETYSKIKPLAGEDMKYLYSMFLYPEKYWKQINYYYNSNKAWIPERNLKKLQDVIGQQERRKEFLAWLNGCC